VIHVKKALAIVLIFMIIGILAIVIPLSIRYDYVQYDKDMQYHAMSLDSGDLLGEYQGVQTKVIGSNINRVFSALTPSSRVRLFKTPDVDPESRLTLLFPDNARFDVYPSLTDSDIAYVYYQYQSKRRWLYISNLDTMNWLKQAISPEGLANENIVVSE
jgi:hypothetical protein